MKYLGGFIKNYIILNGIDFAYKHLIKKIFSVDTLKTIIKYYFPYIAILL